MQDTPPPARRLTDTARAKLNELLAQGIPLARAMQQLAQDPNSFEQVSIAPAPKALEPPPRPAWKGDSTEWGPVVEKLQRLRDLDQGCTVFGAQKHQYELKPTVSEREIVSFEKKIKIALPPGLRTFYTTIGNGGAGPSYGLYGMSELNRHSPAKPYPGITSLRALAAQKKAQPAKMTHATIAPSRLTGLLAVLTAGCGIYSAVVCSGDVGRIVHFDEDGISETDDTLVDLYCEWLDKEIARFELIQRLRDTGATIDEMTKAITKLLPAAEVFRASHEVDDKLRGLAPRST